MEKHTLKHTPRRQCPWNTVYTQQYQPSCFDTKRYFKKHVLRYVKGQHAYPEGLEPKSATVNLVELTVNLQIAKLKGQVFLVSSFFFCPLN